MGEILLTPLSDLASSAVKVADKATLDEIKSLLQNSTYGLSALKSTLATEPLPSAVSTIYINSGTTYTFSYSSIKKLKLTYDDHGYDLSITNLTIDGITYSEANVVCGESAFITSYGADGTNVSGTLEIPCNSSISLTLYNTSGNRIYTNIAIFK